MGQQNVGGGWREILGNVYISQICCGFVVNHIPVVVSDREQLQD